MTRSQAAHFTRINLDRNGLDKWKIRITAQEKGFLGYCSHRDECIILNAHHIDIHPSEEVENTILHEIAHALTPGHAHNGVWQAKAKELGCTSISPCSHLSLSPDIIDAIRSGADVEYTVETEVIHTPKYTVTRLQDKCETCGRVAVEKSSILVESVSKKGPDTKIITLECGHLLVKSIPKGTPFHTLVSNSDNPTVKNCKHVWNKNNCTSCGEYKPFPFQVEGMKFIETALAINKGCLICDEMGLGKTVQADGYLAFHPEAFPVLFGVKSGIKFQMLKEALRWMGIRYVPQAIQSSNDILIPGIQVYIISYDILTPKERKGKNGKTIKQGFDIQKIIDRGIRTLILDECQQIKNPDATRTQQVRRLAKHMNVIALSGTPWKNRGSELFSVLNMIAPTKFHSFEAFKQRWVEFYWNGKYRKEGGIRNVKAFKEYTKDIILRRERSEVMPELPLISRTRHYIELDAVNQETYDEAESDFVDWYNKTISTEDGSENAFSNMTNILAMLAIMRHTTGLAKITPTMEFLEEFMEETERKIVIFVHHKDVAQILLKKCKEKFGDESDNEYRIPILALSADLNSLQRFEMQEAFNKAPRAIMIASTLASGEGLNLQTCADCIMHERQWNPANEEQAEGRFIRIGQQSTTVGATYMTAADTVDDYLDKIIERKRAYFHTAMNKGQMPAWKQEDVIKELVDTILMKQAQKKSKIKKFAQL